MTYKKILIINIFGIGDVLFTTPMVRNIKEHLPDSFVGYMCNKRALAVLETNPLIDKFHVYEKDEWRDIFRESKIHGMREAHRFFLEIARTRYDLVIDLSLNEMMDALTFLAGIRQRIGFNYKARGRFLTTKIPINGFEKKHVVEHYLDLIKKAGFPATHKKMEVFILDEDRQWTERLFKEKVFGPNDLVVGVIPGGGASWGKDARYRRWAPERHAELADKIIENFNVKVILMGDPSEKDIAGRVTSAMSHPALDLVGKTTLGQYLALLSRCRLVVVNDGGPLHMAVAAGAPTVSLIATVDERVYGPYPCAGHEIVTKDIVCRPCYRQFRRADCEHISCLQTIGVDEVFPAVGRLLKK